eukprot:SAG31_NODE_658_length_13104_cov_4.409919_4_plen_118_part_00
MRSLHREHLCRRQSSTRTAQAEEEGAVSGVVAAASVEWESVDDGVVVAVPGSRSGSTSPGSFARACAEDRNRCCFLMESGCRARPGQGGPTGPDLCSTSTLHRETEVNHGAARRLWE